MNIDPSDKPKFEQLIADFFYFNQKYGAEIVMAAMMKHMFDVKADLVASWSEEEKSVMFAEGVKAIGRGSAAAARTIHEELFPFGHAGQPLTIEGGRDAS
jgi:hypothetical protein